MFTKGGPGWVTGVNSRWGFWDPGPPCVLLLPGCHVENKCILDSAVYSCHDVFTALAQPQSNMANQPPSGERLELGAEINLP